MDMDELRRAHKKYKQPKSTVSLNSHDFFGSGPTFMLQMGASDTFSVPEKAYRDIRDSLSDYLSEESITNVIDSVVLPSDDEGIKFVNELLDSRSISTYELHKYSGLDDRILRALKTGQKKLPKHWFFALCMVFRLSHNEIIDAAQRIGFVIDSSLMDVIFMQFIAENKYELGTYVAAVSEAADAIEANLDEYEVSLPAFFNFGYFNNTF